MCLWFGYLWRHKCVYDLDICGFERQKLNVCFLASRQKFFGRQETNRDGVVLTSFFKWLLRWQGKKKIDIGSLAEYGDGHSKNRLADSFILFDSIIFIKNLIVIIGSFIKSTDLTRHSSLYRHMIWSTC